MSATVLRDKAAALDTADPLSHCRDLYLPAEGLVAYLDGNSLGRPLRATAQRITHLVTHDWGTRLIRSWDEQWMELPLQLGDRIGEVCLGAAPGQTLHRLGVGPGGAETQVSLMSRDGHSVLIRTMTGAGALVVPEFPVSKLNGLVKGFGVQHCRKRWIVEIQNVQESN